MTDDELAEPWRAWAQSRPPARHLHLDSAAAGRASTDVVEAVHRHLLDEAALGAYVAEATVEPQIEAARGVVGDLVGIPADGVAFVESASAARTALLASWPFRAGDTVAVAPSEWGPNLAWFAHRGLTIRELAVGPGGAVDLDELARLVHRDPPAVVHLTQVASHRALVQPVAAIAELCSSAGVPVWVDAAQALGHVDTATGADVVYATSRKWLNGPRGVGVLAVAERSWRALRLPPAEHLADDAPPARHLESHEANIAGRVGFAAAVREHVELGPAAVRQRLDDVGRMTRAVLTGITGWAVVGDVDGPGAITSLRPTDGQDVAATRQRLLESHGIVTTVSTPARAPRELTAPLLRISPHVDATPTAIRALRDALATGRLDVHPAPEARTR